MKSILLSILILTASAACAQEAPVIPEPPPKGANPTMIAIRKVYISGSKKHEVRWAKKRLSRFTCLTPVDSVEQADAILDLEPIDYRPPTEMERDPSGAVVCRDKTTASDSKLTCSDFTGSGTRVHCRTGANGDTTCTAYYLDTVAFENALGALADWTAAKADTHAYVLSKQGGKLLWDYDESTHAILWSKKLKEACGCGKHERGH